jgi:hypothetical protein
MRTAEPFKSSAGVTDGSRQTTPEVKKGAFIKEERDTRTARVIVWPQDPTLKPGDAFTLKLWVLPGSTGISSGELELGFDPMVFQVGRMKAGDLLGPGPIVAINEVDTSLGTAKLALARIGKTEAPPVEGTLAMIEISVGSNAPDGDYQLTLNVKLADQNFKAAPLTGTTASRITVSASLPSGAASTKEVIKEVPKEVVVEKEVEVEVEVEVDKEVIVEVEKTGP